MQKFILWLCLLMVGFATPSAHAEPQTPFKTLITFDEFKALDSKKQDVYIEGLQALFADWAKLQEEEKLEYQNASRESSPASIAYEIFFSAARADATPQACVYAGFVSNVDDSGRYCQSSSRCSEPGKTKWVTCNPLVYGGGCAPQGGGASAYCAAHAKSTADIKRYVLSHKQEFMSLRAELTSVCPATKNQTVCQALQFRVGQMYDQVKDQLPSARAEAEVAARDAAAAAQRARAAAGPATRQRPPPGRPRGTGTQGGAEGEFAPSPVAAAPAPAPVSASVVEAQTQTQVRPMLVRGNDGYEGFAENRPKSCPKYGARCQVTALMQPLSGPQDRSWAGKTLMTLDEAQAFYCRAEPINPAFLTSTRSFLKTQQARVRGTATVYDNCSEKRDKQGCIRNTNTYYQCYFKQMEDNFEACYAEAQANRAASRIPNESAVGAILTERGNLIDMKLTGSAQPLNTTTVEPYLGLLFGMYKVDLCKVQKTGAAAPAPAPSSTSTGVPAAPAGAATTTR